MIQQASEEKSFQLSAGSDQQERTHPFCLKLIAES
jgi:hypothetical protein